MNRSSVRARGDGSIVPRGTGFKAQFCISDLVDADGNRKRRFSSKTFANKPEAQQWLREQLSDKTYNRLVEPSKMTVAQMVEQWLAVKAPRLSPNTLNEYRKLTQRINETLGAIPCQKLTGAHVEKFYSSMRKPDANKQRKVGQPLSETTIKRHHEMLTTACKWAVRVGLLINNPCDRAEAPRAARPKPKAWDAAQLQAFLAGAQTDTQACLWRFMAHTGVRRSEALGMPWSAVDFDRGSVSIHRRVVKVGTAYQAVEGTKTPAGTRTINLDAATVLSLRKWRMAQEAGSGLVFPFNGDQVDRAFTKLVQAAGVPDYGIHCLRHTMATLMLKAGVPAKVVSERLGHSDVAFTLKQYQTVLPGMQADAALRFASLMDAGSDTQATTG